MIRNIFFLGSMFLLLIVMPAKAVEFNHAEHRNLLEEELDITDKEALCATCHLDDAQRIKPEGAVCQECHDPDFIDEVAFPGLKTHGPAWALNHRPYAKNEAVDCGTCHRQQDCLDCHKAGFADEMGSFTNNMVNVHRSDFHVTHPLAARAEPQLCGSCHETRFCNECHDQFRREDLAGVSHRRSWSELNPAHDPSNTGACQVCHPNSILPSHDWSGGHAREARKNLTTCQACHPEGDVCLTCHSARSGLGINPHPADWDDIGPRLKGAGDSRTCRKCH
jgi:hypothetical protein